MKLLTSGKIAYLITLTFHEQMSGVERSYGNRVDLNVSSIKVLRSLDSGTRIFPSHKSANQFI
jgi:hypothetical protein